MVDPLFRLAEQGGFFTIMAVVGTASLVAMWRLVVRPALESVTGITSSVREITVANQETAQVLSGMINELREYLPEKKERR
jgi:predicted P-loop ATPase/GTPase